MPPPRPDHPARTGRLERELGVPIPGVILPPERWVQTALKAYPAEGRLDWAALFGRVVPVVLDLGCGNGRFTISSAVTRPTHDHLGLDTLPVVIRYARRRGNQRGLANVRFAVGGAFELLQKYVPPGSVAEVHCYHPQPYYRPDQVHRRLVTPEFLALVHGALIPAGQFVIQTDNPGYWRYIRQVVPVFFDFAERIGPWPDAPRGRTRREIVALKQGLRIFRGSGTAKPGLNADDATMLARELPPPVFDADRRLRRLDALERG